jgi:hypothetical protein
LTDILISYIFYVIIFTTRRFFSKLSIMASVAVSAPEQTFSEDQIARAFGYAPLAGPVRNSIEPLIMNAARDGDHSVLQTAVRYGVLEQTTQFTNGLTYLMAAAQNGHVTVVRFLLENGVNPNTPADDGRTALDFAREDNNQELIELLENYTKTQ